jgi:hypothetical protein
MGCVVLKHNACGRRALVTLSGERFCPWCELEIQQRAIRLDERQREFDRVWNAAVVREEAIQR